MRRQCPFDGCQKQIPENQFACGWHYGMLTQAERREIYHLYANDLVGPTDRLASERRIIDAVQRRIA